MKHLWKYIVGGAIIVLFVGYALLNRQGSETITPTPTVDNNGSGTVAGAGSTTTPATTTGTGTGGIAIGGIKKPTTTTGGGTTTGAYKDGTYTGPVTDAFYGPMQVAAVISGGKLTDVKFLQFPNDPGHTTEVSNDSLPRLKQEAIAAQSAKVSIISGATQTAEAFQQSLAAALLKAKS